MSGRAKLNKNDRQEFGKRIKDPEFLALIDDLAILTFSISRLMPTTAHIPLAHELADGKQAALIALVRKGQDAKDIARNLAALGKEADSLARKLSAFFPEHRRWHWQEVFKTMAFGGSSAVEQRQGGGRPVGAINRTDKLLELAKQFSRSNLSQREYCRRSSIPRSRLRAAVKLWSEVNKPTSD